MKKGIFIILIIGIIIVMVPLVLIRVGNNQLHDSTIPEKENLIQVKNTVKILAFFPHPDDEVTVSGTLMKLIDDGHEVYLVTLTKGEAADVGGKYTRSELGKVRTAEMEHSADIIGAKELHVLDYPDGGLQDLGLPKIKDIALEWIDKIKPEVLISYDSKVGLYGHPDHKLTGLAIQEVFRGNAGKKNFTPKRLYQVTLSPEQIEVALKLSSGFQKNYPKDLSEGLPEPSFYIYTQEYFDRTLHVMKAHESQQEILKDLMPYHDVIPSWIYSRIFDREYFHEVKPIRPPVRMASN